MNETWVVSCWDEAPWLLGPFLTEEQARTAARRVNTTGVRALAMRVEPWRPENYGEVAS